MKIFVLLVASGLCGCMSANQFQGAHNDREPFPVNNRKCVKMCPGDMLPCDPVSYKLADLRCAPEIEN